jgi:HPt (histidine-containing phosphotransfer) domain-containing protein
MNDNLKIIDLNHLDTITGGDENFKKELADIFLLQIPVFIENMKTYYDGNKMEELAREAHTAKSSVLIFGMENAGRLLKEIQHLAENKKIKEIEPALKEVEIDLQQAKTELGEFLNKD